TEESPGTMIFTISGDVRRPGVHELELGSSVYDLVFEVAGGPADGRKVKAVFPGASSTVLSLEQIDTPLDFDSMRRVGSGLGSAGFVVYDDTTCIVRTTLTYSRFLYVESCAQCPACKHGTGQITELLERIDRGEGREQDLETILARALTVTDAQRCALPTGETLIVQSAVQQFWEEFAAHLGRACETDRDIPVPKYVDYDPETGFALDERYHLKRPDWTYAEG
ncbi:MAG TPA: NADH-ubiquinone oxidoreductase-F iron-sulfur binding region domain-containing protein, partial [Actinomycetota bacterium]